MYLFWDMSCIWFELIEFEQYVTIWDYAETRVKLVNSSRTDAGMRLGYWEMPLGPDLLARASMLCCKEIWTGESTYVFYRSHLTSPYMIGQMEGVIIYRWYKFGMYQYYWVDSHFGYSNAFDPITLLWFMLVT